MMSGDGLSPEGDCLVEQQALRCTFSARQFVVDVILINQSVNFRWALDAILLVFDFLQNFVDEQRMLDAFIEHQLQFWCVPSFDSVRDLALQKASGVLKSAKRQPLLGIVPHDAHGHFGFAHIRSHLDADDSHVSNARITQFRQDRRSNNFADSFSSFK